MSENRLHLETSPYLLQHKDNPVHWWAWGPDALAEAKRTGKPILLSVGYAACHWCHVMAHESFEDEATAEVMNGLYVNIKVDREERPDIDAIYMGALHRLGEQGGWPLTMFLDSEARPFWGGTYFPKDQRFGRPAFVTVLLRIAEAYESQPDEVRANADSILASLNERPASKSGFVASESLVRDLVARIARSVDKDHGGLSGAPKFPQWNVFWLLWRGAIRFDDANAKQAVLTTLTHICQGGIYDHLGGGFARYSVDERWLVPHFEKMLYDNALLIDLLTEAWRETQNPLFAARISETVNWLTREMIAEGGGFAASLDADSEGEEGKFYVWTAAEIRDVLGEADATFFGKIYDVTAEGNFEGQTILNRLGSLAMLTSEDEARLAEMRCKLFARRAPRIRPGWDDKVLADWNGLMIASLSRAAVVFKKPEWLDLASTAFAFVSTHMRLKPFPIALNRESIPSPLGRRWSEGPDEGLQSPVTSHQVQAPHLPASFVASAPGGHPLPRGVESGEAHAVESESAVDGSRLWHSSRAGKAKAPATASDYANMTWAALRLYQSTGEATYLEQAKSWTATLDAHHWDDTAGGYFTSADDTDDVIVRLKSASDDAVPSANTIQLWNLIALAALTGEQSYDARARELYAAFSAAIATGPVGHCGLLAAGLDLDSLAQIKVSGDQGPAIAKALRGLSVPGALEFGPELNDVQLSLTVPGGTAMSGATLICCGPICGAPIAEPGAFAARLIEVRQSAATSA